MILAGDIGGTHARIALFSENAGQLKLEQENIYPSRDHGGLGEIINQFLQGRNMSITHACFGIAGPVLNGRVSTSNLPWIIEASALSQETSIPNITLINDLLAHASGIDDLEQSDFVILNAGSFTEGNEGLIAAGTGLGEAGLYWDGGMRHAFPCEGGHTDFAPRNEVEIALLEYLIKKFGHVSYERILSGAGLKNIYDFLLNTKRDDVPPSLQDELNQSADAAAVISTHGLQGKGGICEHSLDIFVSVYGAEAGNLALKLFATGGMFISGGIAAHILPKLTGKAFIEAFMAKGRMQPLLESVPVKIIVNDRIGLIGAARYAQVKQAGEDKIQPVPS